MANQASRSQMMRALLRLRELILSGEFEPGERMAELPLVERLGVSRTPLRLALATLEHEGLLRGLSGGGYAVRAFTQADMRDAVELRGVLEGTAARFAAERGATRREIRSLRTINAQIEPLLALADYESFEAYMDLNERFHARMLEIARSPLLDRALDGILSLPFGGVNAMVLTEAELPESRADPGDRPPPPPGAGRGDRGPAGCSRRGARPRARANRADQPGDRARATARCSSGSPGASLITLPHESSSPPSALVATASDASPRLAASPTRWRPGQPRAMSPASGR